MTTGQRTGTGDAGHGGGPGFEADSGREAGAGRGRRLASTLVGAVLVVFGLRRRSIVGTLAAIAGGALVVRGLGGQDVRSRVSQLDTESVGPLPDIGTSEGPVTVETSITIDESPDELYDLWRDEETLSRMLGQSVDVRAAGEDRQRWTIEGPMDRRLSWEADVEEADAGEYLRWEAAPGADLPNEGSVRFVPAPGDQGTEVTLEFRFDPPGGSVTSTALQRLGVVPETLAERALDRFKSLAETGEMPTLENNPSGRGQGDLV